MLFPVASRAFRRPSVIVLALIAVSAAGCSSDTSRFDSSFNNPFSSFSSKPQPPAGDVTASINATPSSKIETRSLPAPGQTAGALPPATRHAGISGGGNGTASYHPGSADITGSVAAPARPAWNWEGGTPVTVGPNDTVESLSKRHGVPASVILQANGITSPAGVKPGQRLVIPKFNSAASAPRSVVSQPATGTHTVAPGETMIGIAKRYNVSLKELAKANSVEPHAQLKMGDRVVIPGRAAAASGAKPQIASAAKPAPVQAQAPKTPSLAGQKMASVEPQQTARALQPAADADADAKSASGAPSFRWPVRGRIIAGFGPKPNGQQNDGINLSVPEGTPIKAAEDGVVAYAGNELKGYGNLVLIRHPNGFVTAYAHASELLVKRGDPIKRGQTIAKAGQTGTVTSPQVHFEIRKGSSPVDPTQYLNGA